MQWKPNYKSVHTSHHTLKSSFFYMW